MRQVEFMCTDKNDILTKQIMQKLIKNFCSHKFAKPNYANR